MIELKNVEVRYKDNAERDSRGALAGVNLRINDGEFVFIVGDSGAGKSTLLKLLTLEKQPSAGRVFVNGYNLANIKPHRVPNYRRTIGMIFQDFRLIPSMTVYDNVAYVLRVTDKSSRFIRQRVPYVLSLVKLSEKAKSYPSQLSGGEQQRVAIARAFATEPKLIIADEPTGNIDPQLSYDIVSLLLDLNKLGSTVLMVTHDHDLVQYFGGRVMNLKKGTVTYDDYIPPDGGGAAI
ncbi:MAG: ATP-binding cassette domain-containing protein [Oscillospiraceae bacterium]|jgi:cell division transport system ATP-binding protein|nr:ATP-binding cassette domain-containing protein [Oscillospiraceae bacterium]